MLAPAIAFAAAAPAPVDEAQRAGRSEASFPQATEDFFHDMDNGAQLTADEVQGRNMWIVWTGGNDRFWDSVSKDSLATFDILKVITSHPSQTYCDGQHCDRDSRWHWLGALNEPCFEKPTAPDPKRFGLWLDVRSANCAPDPFENEAKYPGVKLGARGTTFKDGSSLPVGSYFGYASGIVGLRLFPNPYFDQAAKDKWDPERYYTDPNYYNDPNLVRPYRVGMACGFCHVGPSPIHPPANPAHPQWSDLNSTVGAQYLWIDRVFDYAGDAKNFLYQLVHSYAPGTVDTSLVSTDYINNPRTMNAVYLLGPRLAEAKLWGKETLKGPQLGNKQLPGFFDPPDTSWSARVLKDGSDSVGIFGALNRVYLNIGLYSEEWTRHFNPFFGGKPITPIEIATADKNSAYWRATEAGTPFMAKFLVAAGQPDSLATAPGGEKYLTADAATLDRGKKVFAETCARCHSSKLPDEARAARAGRLFGPGLSQVLQSLLGLYEDRRIQGENARHRRGSRFPQGQLSVDRRARPGDASAHQRLQSAWHQRDPRQYLGQFLVRDLQEPAFGRQDHATGPVHRRALAVSDARRRPRLHPRALADQHLVDRAVPGQQPARTVFRRRLGRWPDEELRRVNRAAPMAGEARARTRFRRLYRAHH
jgi:cytochrome c5